MSKDTQHQRKRRSALFDEKMIETLHHLITHGLHRVQKENTDVTPDAQKGAE